jgi:hypothetical protein
MKLNYLFLLYYCCGSVMASAGDWSSSGGKLTSDAENPWFVDNTLEVTYCIEIDERHFGQTREVASRRFREALDYWAESFKYALTEGDKARVATQRFTETNCSDSTMLRVQLGTLTETQRKEIGRPQDFVGVTMRTEYDRKNLVGKGFIYISPSSGDLTMTDETVLENPWEVNDGNLLKGAFVHELGHVFGLRHDASVPYMASIFPYRVVSKSRSREFTYRRYVPSSFGYESKAGEIFGNICFSEPSAPLKVLGLPGGCYQVTSTDDEHIYILWRLTSTGKDPQGEIRLAPGYRVEASYPMLTLDSTQEVYDLPAEQKLLFAQGIGVSKRVSGQFVNNVSGKKIPLFFFRNGVDIELSPAANDEIMDDKEAGTSIVFSLDN